ncbi:hypothetical protein C0Q70_01149 [Pomacea canaliculata]|uniref:Uncharacterized protein n=1 Tax=Pomacea canaliculata TaxID=400727 RepID=A0A2T7PYN1_POMCA|nr:hypothetical protein C0Q70_01149 [Pomacea canaliculata]
METQGFQAIFHNHSLAKPGLSADPERGTSTSSSSRARTRTHTHVVPYVAATFTKLPRYNRSHVRSVCLLLWGGLRSHSLRNGKQGSAVMSPRATDRVLLTEQGKRGVMWEGSKLSQL